MRSFEKYENLENFFQSYLSQDYQSQLILVFSFWKLCKQGFFWLPKAVAGYRLRQWPEPGPPRGDRLACPHIAQ